jgi:hypothetical protein
VGKSELEKLAHRGEGGTPDLETDWAGAAKKEREWREHWGVTSLCFGVAFAALGTWALFDRHTFGDDFWAPYGLTMGAYYGLQGIYNLASEGPVETAFHAYERGTGRTIPRRRRRARSIPCAFRSSVAARPPALAALSEMHVAARRTRPRGAATHF